MVNEQSTVEKPVKGKGVVEILSGFLAWVFSPPRVAILCGILWVWLFCLGYSYVTTLDTEAAVPLPMTQLTEEVGRTLCLWFLSYIFMSLIWRWTNILYLAVFASVIGEVGKWATRKSGRRADPSYSSALVRGFYVFLLTLTGQVIISGGVDPPKVAPANTSSPPASIAHVDEGRYFRLAGAASLLGFLASFYPGFFRRLMNQVEAADSSESAEKVKPPA